MSESESSSKKVRITYYLKEENAGWLKENFREQDAKSASDFLDRIVEFYRGFLLADRVDAYLLSTFAAALNGSIGGLEDRLIRMLFKMEVEISMLNRIVGYGRTISDEEIDRLREIAVQEIRTIQD